GVLLCNVPGICVEWIETTRIHGGTMKLRAYQGRMSVRLLANMFASRGAPGTVFRSILTIRPSFRLMSHWMENGTRRSIRVTCNFPRGQWFLTWFGLVIHDLLVQLPLLLPGSSIPDPGVFEGQG